MYIIHPTPQPQGLQQALTVGNLGCGGRDMACSQCTSSLTLFPCPSQFQHARKFASFLVARRAYVTCGHFLLTAKKRVCPSLRRISMCQRLIGLCKSLGENVSVGRSDVTCYLFQFYRAGTSRARKRLRRSAASCRKLGFTRYRAQINSSELFLESLSFLLDCFYYDISLDYDILDKGLWAGVPGKLRPWEQIL
jgi:hypothetical protein